MEVAFIQLSEVLADFQKLLLKLASVFYVEKHAKMAAHSVLKAGITQIINIAEQIGREVNGAEKLMGMGLWSESWETQGLFLALLWNQMHVASPYSLSQPLPPLGRDCQAL